MKINSLDKLDGMWAKVRGGDFKKGEEGGGGGGWQGMMLLKKRPKNPIGGNLASDSVLPSAVSSTFHRLRDSVPLLVEVPYLVSRFRLICFPFPFFYILFLSDARPPPPEIE